MAAGHITQTELAAEQADYELARKGLKTLKSEAKKDKTFMAWFGISQGFGRAQGEAFRVTGSNNNQGREYATAFSHILDREGLNDADWLNKPTRAALLELYAHQGAIIAWRQTLPPHRQADMNNPRTVVANWKKSFAPPRKPDPPHPDEVTDEDVGNGDLAGLASKEKKATTQTNEALRRELAEAKGMIIALKAEVARLEALIGEAAA